MHMERKAISDKVKRLHIRNRREDRVQLPPLRLPDPARGLSGEEVSAREEQGLVNQMDSSGIRSTGDIIRSHTLTYFNFLNLFLGAIVFMTGSYKNMLFLGVVICNTVIGIVQELRVKKLIDQLSVITAAKARVIRDGRIREIDVSQIVQDDIVTLSAGDQIVTDGPLVSSGVIEVNESMLTGESKPVSKKPGELLLSGSFVVAGSGTMRAERVGRECYAAGIVEKSRHRRSASSEMLVSINRIIKVVSVVIIPVGLLLYRSQWIAAQLSGLSGKEVFNASVVRTVSGVIGMIPEGLVLLTSVSFILGVGRLARKRALVQDMYSIESLARADILCTDKTGTITTGELKVNRLVAVGDVSAELIRNVMSHIGGAFEDVNDTQRALDRYFGKRKDWTVRQSIPFSSDRKYKAVDFPEGGAYVLGAPEYLLPDRAEILDYVERFASQGFRCLLLCSSDGISAEREETGRLTPLAVIVISDIIREDARETFAYFAKAGVAVKVLSGDNPAAVSAVAQAAGVADAASYVDAGTLPKEGPALAEAIRRYTVFGRVRPEQKQAFIKAWQANGCTVAMVGDGVNDVLAIKDADCGIAMANGSEAAKQAAHVVLLDSDFAGMQSIVGEGKTIICNIERVSSLYLTKTIYSAILCVLFIFLAAAYPWTTLQMGLINIVGIGIPSLLLTLERHENWRSGGFLENVIKVCVPSALTMVITIVMTQVCRMSFHWTDDMYSFFAVMLGGLVSLLVVAQVTWPMTRYRRIVFGISCAVFFAAVIFLPGFYDIHSLWTPWSLMLIPLGILISVIISVLSQLTNRLSASFLAARRRRRKADKEKSRKR